MPISDPSRFPVLFNPVRWAAGDAIPLSVEGAGLVDCHLYRQPGRLILHLVNLTSAGTWRAPVEEFIPVGPLRIRVRLPEGMAVSRMKLLVSDVKPSLAIDKGAAVFRLPPLTDHEVAVLE